MTHIIDQIKARWSSQGVAIPPGASHERLDAFEKRFGVSLPADMRLFYAAVNGMGSADQMDENMITLRDIDSVVSCRRFVRAEKLATNPRLADYYVFGGMNLGLPHFCIGLCGANNDVVALWKAKARHERICFSFSEFLSLYVGDKL
jgi:hypothetical protein